MSNPLSDSPRAVADRFYAAFARRDGAAMTDAYGASPTFSDPVFASLRGAEVGAMWRMLAARAKGFSLQYQIVSADDQQAVVTWQAEYLFSATGRTVLNSVTTEMRIENGRIVAQEDRFDFYRWTAMALGLVGTLLGWTPLLKSKIRKQARAGLEDFMRREAAGEKVGSK